MDSDSDDDSPVFYAHAIDDGLLASAASKQEKALKHFNHFLKGYCDFINADPVEAKDLSRKGFTLPPNKDGKKVEFWDQVIGCFVTYLGRSARQRCDPKCSRLSFNTSDGFLSSVKMYFVNKRNEKPIPIFQPSNTKTLRNKLKGLYRESDRLEGKRKTEEVSSTRQDREAMATACIWSGTAEFAQFWHLLNTSFHCTGRGSEVSLIKSEGVTTIEVNELTYKYDVLAVNLQRQKNSPSQVLPVYPHRDGLFECFYFSLIHMIVVTGCCHEYVLPLFSNAGLRTKKSGVSDSGVSKQWTKFFKSIRSTFECLADEINEELGSHSNRRGSNQSMIENPSLNGYAAIYRSGLKSKSIHTIFDYIFGSATLLRQAGSVSWLDHEDK